ncbi:KR domain-containing protein, partial [Streptomyces sparsogenes]|uniref:KR domain-containing protein n=1 Tax=Streptomyces sparsogenes TaxID=67365 RepID=UPI0033D34516
INWHTWFPTPPAPGTEPPNLPTYPFQRQRYWGPDEVADAPAAGADAEETRFWHAVEAQDLPGLSEALGLGAEDGRRASLDALLPTLSHWRRERHERSTVSAWRYRVGWRRLPDPGQGSFPAEGPWLLVVPPEGAGEWAEACERALTAGGAEVRLLPAGDLAPGLLRAALADGPPPAGVLSLLALDERPHAAAFPAVSRGLTATHALLRAVLEAEVDAPLYSATRGAVAAGDGEERPSAPAQAQVWGLGRVAALEHPAAWGGLIDLPASADDLTPGLLRAALAGRDGEDQVALRSEGVYGRRVLPAPLDGPNEQDERAWTPRDGVLVTGGVTGVAAHVARWLAAGGTKRIVLLAPGGQDAPGGAELVASLAELGAEATVVDGVPSGPAARRELADQLAASGPRVRTIVHAGTAGEPVPLAGLTPDGLAEALSNAVADVDHLPELCGLEADDPVVVFSSVVGVWGVGEQGARAAAEAYLDAVAQRREAAGGPVVRVAWGPWNDEGAVRADAAERAERHGLSALDPGLALTALRRTLDGGEGHAVLADVHWERFVPVFTMVRPSRLFEEIPAARRAARDAEDDAGSAKGLAALRERLAAQPPQERDGTLLALVRTHVANALRYASAESLDPQQSFKDLGFDSVAAIEFRNRLRGATGLTLPATLVFDYPTPTALAGYLVAQVMAEDSGTEPAAAHLDGIEAVLAALDADDPRRSGLTHRLRVLLWRYEGGAEPQDEQQTGDELASASADEMFALIDREFGES